MSWMRKLWNKVWKRRTYREAIYVAGLEGYKKLSVQKYRNWGFDDLITMYYMPSDWKLQHSIFEYASLRGWIPRPYPLPNNTCSTRITLATADYVSMVELEKLIYEERPKVRLYLKRFLHRFANWI